MSELESRKQLPTAGLPPAQPAYILRGHAVPVHSLLFLNDNLWLISGDADGYVVLWILTTKRPIAVWQAHEGSILGLGVWNNDKLITHGRDSRLRVWSLDGIGDSNAGFSTKLPIENTTVERKQPWLIHALPVSTLNFCSFAGLEDSSSRPRAADEAAYAIAVPGTKDSDIEIYQLPTEKQMGLIPAPAQSSGRAGMVMALGLLRHGEKNTLLVACGYENGLVCLYKHVTQVGGWEMTYSARPHSQPVLSLDVSLSKEAFYTSSADAVIAKHPLHKGSSAMKELATGHSGQQGLRIRNDDKIFATAGWDSRIRVYSSHSLKEVAVLKWHKEGCYAIAFASMNNVFETNAETNMAKMREDRVRNTHWLAAGSKDGKVSLWDIY